MAASPCSPIFAEDTPAGSKSAREPTRPLRRRSTGPGSVADLAPDVLVADRYRLVRRLGEGAWAVTWLAWDEHLDQDRTLQFVRPERVGPEQVRAAYNFRDPHGGVIHHDGKLVGGNIVATPEQEVGEVVPGDELLPSEMAIGEGNGLAVGNAETPAYAGGRIPG